VLELLLEPLPHELVALALRSVLRMALSSMTLSSIASERIQWRFSALLPQRM
jgi:hypothetical protein